MDEVPPRDAPTPPRVWGDLGIGALGAILACSVAPLDRVLRALLTLFHELGHTVMGWVFGYPGLPAFDLRYGGGVTSLQARSPAVLAGAYLLLLGALALLRGNPRGRGCALLALAAFAVCAHSDVHRWLILAAGHGGELVLGGLFLYRGMTGGAGTREVERPLYVAVAGYVVLRGVALGWGLVSDPRARTRYENAKGGGHIMDFSRLAERHLDVPLEWVAGAFVLACLAMPVVVWWIHRHRARLGSWIREALALD